MGPFRELADTTGGKLLFDFDLDKNNPFSGFTLEVWTSEFVVESPRGVNVTYYWETQ